MASLGTLDPEVRPYFQAWIDLLSAHGFRPRITSTRRSFAAQRALYEAWLAGRNKYPVAVPGTSLHERGLAVDIVMATPEHATYAGRYWQQLHPAFRWGGARDPVHFEIRI